MLLEKNCYRSATVQTTVDYIKLKELIYATEWLSSLNLLNDLYPEVKENIEAHKNVVIELNVRTKAIKLRTKIIFELMIFKVLGK